MDAHGLIPNAVTFQEFFSNSKSFGKTYQYFCAPLAFFFSFGSLAGVEFSLKVGMMCCRNCLGAPSALVCRCLASPSLATWTWMATDTQVRSDHVSDEISSSAVVQKENTRHQIRKAFKYYVFSSPSVFLILLLSVLR